ncbi:MAG TPA: BTAD domain-containing putative transcriptional regulator [Chloroflexota bacterium]|nr:BTAD domain-containing putative transcriptional regulator [Chloroflexota bacterium]
MGRTLPEALPAFGISVRALGGLEVVLATGRQVQWRRRTRELFTILLSAPNGIVPRDEIAYSIWPDSDSFVAFQNLRSALSALRRALLSAGRIPATPEGIMLNVPPEARDDVRFESLAGKALGSNDFEVVARAMSQWAGEYLPGDRYLEWTQYRRIGLADLHTRLARHAGELARSKVESERALEWLRPVMAADATDEASARAAMRLWLRLGRRTEAVRRFQILARALSTELGIEPDGETIELHEEARA